MPDNTPKLLRLRDVMDRTGMRRSTIYYAVKHYGFPSPVKLTPRCSAWPSDLVDAWIESRISASRDGKGDEQ